MESRIEIPEEIIKGYLYEIKRDEIKWSMIAANIGANLEMSSVVNDPSVKGNLNDPLYLRRTALETVNRLLADKTVITVRERLGIGTEVWDLEPKEVTSLLEKEWDAYAHGGYRKGESSVFFYSRADINLLEKHYSKPITIIRESSLISST